MAVAAHIRFAAAAHAEQVLPIMSIADLVSLHEAMLDAAETFLNQMNLPRCRASVASILEDEFERCNMLAELIYEEVRRRKPVDADEVAARLRLLVSWNMGSVQTPLDLLEMVHSLQAVEIH